MEETSVTICPRCRGRRLADGRLGEWSDQFEFRPKRLKVCRLPRVGLAYRWRTIFVRPEWRLCLDCGLVWSMAEDLPMAVAGLRHWGREDLKRKLGLVEMEVEFNQSDLE